MAQAIFRSICSREFLKFSAVGCSNLIIDFALLNLLSFATGIYAGFGIVVLNVIAFAVAVTNSYFWNKFWTFRRAGPLRPGEYSKFFAVNAVGSFMNSGVVYTVTTLIGPAGGIHPQLWLNIAKVIALPFSTAWNFLGSKFFIFAPAPRPESPHP